MGFVTYFEFNSKLELIVALIIEKKYEQRNCLTTLVKVPKMVEL